MKYLLAFFLFFLIATASAQNMLTGDIPKTGIILKDGWKFHSGDNINWAKADFDDNSWEEIDPTKNIGQIPQISKQAVGWLRIRFRVDSTWLYKPLAFQVYQSIASEIYLNGKPLKRYGVVSKNQHKIVAYQPHNEPEGIVFEKVDQVLAIRFSVQPNLPYFSYISPYHVFVYRINSVKGAAYVEAQQSKDLALNSFESGMFILLALIHFTFFVNYRKQKANLYFALSAFSIGSGHLFFGLITTSNSIAFKSYASVIDYPLVMPVYGLFFYLAVWDLFSKKKTLLFWLLIFYVAIGTIAFSFDYHNGPLWGMFIPLLLTALESLRISWLAFRERQTGVQVIVIGILAYFILFATAMLAVINIIPNPQVYHEFTLVDVTYNASLFCAPVSLSIYLSRQFATTSKNLETRLIEVKQLSEEKQNALQQKNAELQAALLQGQTTERKRVAADLHDNLGSSLTALRWNLQALKSPEFNPLQKRAYDNLKTMLDQAHTEVRLLSHNLLPEELQKLGLKNTLEGFIKKINQNTSICFGLNFPENFPRLSPKIEFELYSICLELINNTIKHAKATEGSVRFDLIDTKMFLTVSDNGKGISIDNGSGKGLQNIEERVQSLNGNWKVKSDEGVGTVHEIEVPIRS